MGTFVAHIIGFQGSVARQFTLYRQRPLLDVRIAWLFRDDYSKESAAVLRWADLMQRHWRKSLIRRLWKSRNGIRTEGGADDNRVYVPSIIDLARLGGVEENSVAAANYRFVRYSVSKARARCKGLLGTVGRVASPAVSIKAVIGGSNTTAKCCDSIRYHVPLGQALSAAWIRSIEPTHLHLIICGY